MRRPRRALANPTTPLLVWLALALAGCGVPSEPAPTGPVQVAPDDDLASAVATARAGATLELDAGTYTVERTLLLRRDVTILGVPGTTIRGTGPALQPGDAGDFGVPLLYARGVQVTLHDLEIRYEGAAEATVVVLEDADFELRRIGITGGVNATPDLYLGDGLLIRDGSTGTLEDVTASANGWNGVTIVESDVTATDLTASGNGASGLTLNAASATVQSLVADQNANGLYVMAGTAAEVTGSPSHASLADNASNGAMVLGDGVATLDSLRVADNEEAGVLALGESDVTLVELIVEDNAHSGIVFADSARGKVRDGAARRNGWSGAEVIGDA